MLERWPGSKTGCDTACRLFAVWWLAVFSLRLVLVTHIPVPGAESVVWTFPSARFVTRVPLTPAPALMPDFDAVIRTARSKSMALGPPSRQLWFVIVGLLVQVTVDDRAEVRLPRS
jgi:hypothetical protein